MTDRLTMVSNGNSATKFLQYDEAGQVLQSQQITGPQTYAPFIYTYNLMGSLQSVQYPSGRVVAMNFDPGSAR